MLRTDENHYVSPYYDKLQNHCLKNRWYNDLLNYVVSVVPHMVIGPIVISGKHLVEFSFTYCITLYFRGRKISRKVNFKYFREKIFSRIYCSRENIFPRKYLLAKISSRENIFPRKYCILPRKSFACFVSVASFSLFAAR